MKRHFIFVLIGIMLTVSVPISMVLPLASALPDHNQKGHDNHAKPVEHPRDGKNQHPASSNSSDGNAPDPQQVSTVVQPIPTAENQSITGTVNLHAKGLAVIDENANATLQSSTISLKGVFDRSPWNHDMLFLQGTIIVGSDVYQVFSRGSLNLHNGHNLDLLLLNGKATNGKNYNLAMRFIAIHDSGNTFTIIGDPVGRIGVHTRLYAEVGRLTLITGGSTSGGETGPGAFDHFQISPITNQTVGQTFSFTVSAIANNGNVKTNYNGTVTMDTNDGASPSGDQTDFVPLTYAFGPSDHGVHTFSAKMFNAMNGVNISVSGSGKSGQSNAFDVFSTQVATVNLNPSSVTLAPNGTATFMAQAFDAYSNPIPNQTFLWSESTGSIGILIAGSNSSIESLHAPLTSSGASGTVTATASGTAIGNSASVNVNATSIFLDHFAISTISNQTAGHQFSLIVTAIDNMGHIMTGFNGEVNMTTSDTTSPLGNSSVISPASYTFQSSDAGQHVFTATLYKAINGVTISASGWGKTGTSNPFNVQAGPISRVVVTPSNITLIANATVSISANATDAFGNIVSSNFNWSLSSPDLGTIMPTSSTQGATLKAANVHSNTKGTLTVTASGISVSLEVPIAVNV